MMMVSKHHNIWFPGLFNLPAPYCYCSSMSSCSLYPVATHQSQFLVCPTSTNISTPNHTTIHDHHSAWGFISSCSYFLLPFTLLFIWCELSSLFSCCTILSILVQGHLFTESNIHTHTNTNEKVYGFVVCVCV